MVLRNLLGVVVGRVELERVPDQFVEDIVLVFLHQT